MKQKTPDKGYYFIIKLHIYPFDVIVSVDEPDEVIGKRLKNWGHNEEECASAMNPPEAFKGYYVLFPSNRSLIRFKTQKNWRGDMVGVVVHEAFYLTSMILDRIGMKFKLNVSDEAYAYLVEYLTVEIIKKLK